MIFHKLCQIVIHTWTQTTLAFFYIHNDVTEIKNAFNKEFANMYEWFVDNKLSIHFSERKTRCILLRREKKPAGA